MRKVFFLGFEFLSYIAAGLIVGWYLEARFNLSGMGILASLFIVYILWFFRLYKKIKK